MDRKKEIKEELEQISPFLAGLKKEQNFKVPTNYFNDLQEDLWKQVQPQPQRETQSTPKRTWLEEIELALASLFQPRMALSLASLLLLLTVGWYFMQPPVDSNSIADASLPTLEEVSDYLADHLDDFDADSCKATKPIERGTPDDNFNFKPPKDGIVVRVHSKILDGYVEPKNNRQSAFQKSIGQDNLWIREEEKKVLEKVGSHR